MNKVLYREKRAYMGIIFSGKASGLLMKRLFRCFKKNYNRERAEKELSPIKQAVMYIEIAERFANRYQEILNCNQITMWPEGSVGAEWVVEFFGLNPYLRSTIQKLLADTSGTWQIWEDSTDPVLHIVHTGAYSYKGSWKRFNKAVWSEVKRKHPDWEIEKAFSGQYVLWI